MGIKEINIGTYALILAIMGSATGEAKKRAYPDRDEALGYISSGIPFVGEILTDKQVIEAANAAEEEEIREESVVDNNYVQLQIFA